MLDIFGYCASAMIAISLMVKDIYLLRWLNLLGCAMFALYGGLAGAWPVTIANAFVSVVNIYHIGLLYKKRNNSHEKLTIS